MKTYGRKIIMVSLLTTLYCLTTFEPAISAQLDPPHNSGADYDIGCTTCHDMTAFGQPNLIPDFGHIPTHIDDSLYNKICLDCHKDPSFVPPEALIENTHSSLQSSNQYGDWSVECCVCHNQHTQEQAGNKFIRSRIDLSTISGVTKTGVKRVVFTGADSFAENDKAGGDIDVDGNDDDQTPNGICQVCHDHVGVKHWKNDGTKAGIGIHNQFSGTNCMICHDHNLGFKATAPDHNMVKLGYDIDSNSTDDSYIGCAACHYEDLLDEHVLRRGILCEECHARDELDPPEAQIDAITTTITDGRSGTTVFCNNCHNDAHFISGLNTASGSKTFLNEHHLTTDAVKGKCTKCHVVGRGIDGPIGGPCGKCHGDSRFATQHANASDFDLADVDDYRVCFSCHLSGTQGYQDGVTPAVVPFHHLPAEPMYPSDLWVSDQCGDASCDPATTVAVNGLPDCAQDGSTYMCDNFVEMMADPQAYITSNSGFLSQTEEDAVLNLAKTQPGFGLYDLKFAKMYVKGNGHYQARAEIVDGTIMDVNPSTAGTKRGNGYGQWAMATLANMAETGGRYENYFEGVSTPFIQVPISFDDGSGSGLQEYQVLTLDGSGGGGMQTSNGNEKIQVNIEAVDDKGDSGFVTVPTEAAWRHDGLGWKVDIEANVLRPRKHLVEFKKVANWATPAPVIVQVESGTATVAVQDSTYVQCRQISNLTINGSPTISWDSATMAVEYTLTGWPYSEEGLKPPFLNLPLAQWELDTGGAEGFKITSTGTNSAKLEKIGTTVSGSYNFTISANATDCFGNSNSLSISVDVSGEGALSPYEDIGIGTIDTDYIDTLAVSPIHDATSTHVTGDLFARIDCRGKVQTFNVYQNGKMDDTVIQEVDLGFTDAFTNRRLKYDAHILLVHENTDGFILVASLGKELKTLRVDEAGNITSLGSTLTMHSVAKGANIFRGPADDVFIVSYYPDMNVFKDHYIRTFRVDNNGQLSWISSPWKYEYHPYFGFVMPDIVHVSGNVYAIMALGGTSGYLSDWYGRLHTFTVAANGALAYTKIDSFKFDDITDATYARIFRLSDSNYFGLLYKDNNGNGILKTLSIADNGIINKKIKNTLYIEQVASGIRIDVVPISDDIYGFVGFRNGANSISSSTRVIFETYRITTDGIIDPVPIDTFKKRMPWGASPKILTVSSDVYLVTVSNGAVYTIGIISDQDGDDVLTADDNCLDAYNPDQVDIDSDGIGDACDACPNDPNNDWDNDGVCGDLDICPSETIDDQDGDGLCGGVGYDSAFKNGDNDNCPTISNVDQLDTDGDGNGDICEHMIPDTPTNIIPVNGQVEVSRSPALSANAFTGGIGPHHASQWQISTAHGGGFETGIIYDSYSINDLTSHILQPLTLNFNTTYYWRVRYQNDSNYWSAFSPETSFTTMTLPPDVLAVWKFDEGSGTKAFDETGTENTGLLGSTTAWNTGAIGTALSFNGTSDYIHWADDSFLPFGSGSAMTVEFRFKSTDTQGWLIQQWQFQYADLKSWYIYLDGGKINFLINDNGGFSQTTCTGVRTDLADGSWHHVAVVYDDVSDNMDTYIDGVIDCDGTTPYTLGPDRGSTSFDMGAYNVGPWYDKFYNGLLDEVVIYDRALTPAEISARHLAIP